MSKKRTLTILASSLTLFGLTFILYQNHQAPALGVTDGKFRPLSPKPNGVSTQATDPDKLIEPLPFKTDAAETMRAIKKALDSYGGYEIKAETQDYLRVVFITPTLRFRDDAEFWLDEEERVVHFRSQSRLGHSDLGLNRTRYKALKKSYLEI